MHLRDELISDPLQLGYLPLIGDVEVFEHLEAANKYGIHEGIPIKVKKVMKLVGNDVKNAELINKKVQGSSRAESLWGEGIVITAQEIANTAENSNAYS